MFFCYSKATGEGKLGCKHKDASSCICKAEQSQILRIHKYIGAKLPFVVVYFQKFSRYHAKLEQFGKKLRRRRRRRRRGNQV